MFGIKGMAFSAGFAAFAIGGTWHYLKQNNPELQEQIKSKEGITEATTNFYSPVSLQKLTGEAPATNNRTQDAKQGIIDKFTGKVSKINEQRNCKLDEVGGISDTSAERTPSVSVAADNSELVKLRAENQRLNSELAELRKNYNDVRDKYTSMLLGKDRAVDKAPEVTADTTALKNELNEYKDRYFKLLHQYEDQKAELEKVKKEFEEAFNSVVSAETKDKPEIKRQAFYYRTKCQKLEETHKQVLQHYKLLTDELKAELEQYRTNGKKNSDTSETQEK